MGFKKGDVLLLFIFVECLILYRSPVYNRKTLLGVYAKQLVDKDNMSLVALSVQQTVLFRLTIEKSNIL